jgi:hypothetical protein
VYAYVIAAHASAVVSASVLPFGAADRNTGKSEKERRGTLRTRVVLLDRIGSVNTSASNFHLQPNRVALAANSTQLQQQPGL